MIARKSASGEKTIAEPVKSAKASERISTRFEAAVNSCGVSLHFRKFIASLFASLNAPFFPSEGAEEWSLLQSTTNQWSGSFTSLRSPSPKSSPETVISP